MPEKIYLGIELGSTRIKAVLIDESFAVLASGAHAWENRLENGVWTYSLESVRTGLSDAYAHLAADYKSTTGKPLVNIDGIGISAMMHGFLAFDKDMNLLTPFRTWRNTTAGYAAQVLTETFGFKIPMRWSIAHLYQAILNKEPYLAEIAHVTTLAGYVHYMLTGEKVLGVGDASGMFPIDPVTLTYDTRMKDKFQTLTDIDIADIFPKVLCAGKTAGTLTPSGTALLDPSGSLSPGAMFCPPEGDAGTGMVATNSVAPRTGNISAGTSIFAMLVLESPLTKPYHEIDIVTTPHGKPVAMVHANTCTSDMDSWIKLFGEVGKLLGASFDTDKLYESLYNAAQLGSPDGAGLLSYNFYSGEPVAYVDNGCPMLLRSPESAMTLADFMRVQLYSAVAVLRLGKDILTLKENVVIESLMGHGGLFKIKDVGQQIMASALDVPITVTEQAGEGGAWGIALLSTFAAEGISGTLEHFLECKVFSAGKSRVIAPDPDGVTGFNTYMARYMKGLTIARQAAEVVTKIVTENDH